MAAAEEEPADLFGRTVRDHLNERSGDGLADALEVLVTREGKGKGGSQGVDLLLIADTHNGWARGLGRV